MLLGEEVKVRLWRIVLPGSVLAVLLAWFSGTFVQYHWQQQQALSSYHEMSALRARLEGEINAAVNLTQGLAAWVAANEDQIDDDRFARFGQTLLRGQSSVRNITLAPGNVIRYVYPIAGNEAAMGLDLNSHPQQSASVYRMMADKAPVLTGPVQLVQGGTAFIQRTPLYVNDAAGGRYWGLLSVPIDLERLVAAVGLPAWQTHYDLALRVVSEPGKAGTVFWGDAAVFSDVHSVRMPIVLPHGVRWELGWRQPQAMIDVLVWGVRGLVLLLLLLLFGLVVRLWLSQQALSRALLHDGLTGVLNRSGLIAAFDQLRRRDPQSGMGLLFLDLDNFKPINDEYGHSAGDQLLCELAQRLTAMAGHAEVVARLGGDEFVLLVPGNPSLEQMIAHQQAMLRMLALPVQLADGRSLSMQASVGHSLCRGELGGLDGLLRAADQAMYVQKEAHRRMRRASV